MVSPHNLSILSVHCSLPPLAERIGQHQAPCVIHRDRQLDPIGGILDDMSLGIIRYSLAPKLHPGVWGAQVLVNALVLSVKIGFTLPLTNILRNGITQDSREQS